MGKRLDESEDSENSQIMAVNLPFIKRKSKEKAKTIPVLKKIKKISKGNAERQQVQSLQC